MKNSLNILFILIAAFILVQPAWVHAIPTASVRIISGSTTIDIVDNGIGDFDLAEGKIVYSGSIGIFTTNMVMALTKPIMGTQFNPIMELSSLEVNSLGGTDTISILFSDIGYGPLASGLGGFETSVMINSALGSSVVGFNTYLDESNTLFGMDTTATELAHLGPYANNVIDSTSTYVSSSVSSPFSLTSTIEVTHSGMTNTFVSSTLAPLVSVPEPGALLLLGSGLIGAAIVSRKIKVRR